MEGKTYVAEKQQSTRRAGTAARRRDILSAALSCFIENGFDATSLRQIAVRADMTHAGLLHHYESKEALVSALLRQRDEQDEEFVRAFMQEAQPNTGRAPALFALLAHNRASPGEMRFWGELCAAASRPGHLSQVYFAARYRSLRLYMEEVLRRRAQAGALRNGIKPEMVAMLLPAVLDGLQSQWLLDQSIAMDEAIDYFLSLFLRGGATLVEEISPPENDRSVSPHAYIDPTSALNGRQRIVAAAIDLFTDRGFGGTSIMEIAAEAGYSKASVLYHFETKEELLHAALQPLGDALEGLGFTLLSTSLAPDAASAVSALVDLCVEHRALFALIAGLAPAACHRSPIPAWTDGLVVEMLVRHSRSFRVGIADFAVAAIPTYCRQSASLPDGQLREHLTLALNVLLEHI